MVKIFKETVIYGLGNALSKFCALLLFPIYAKILTAEQFALQDLALATSSILALLCSMGMDSGYARLYHDGENGRANLATTWGIFALLSVVPGVFLAIFFRDNIATRVIGDPASSDLLLWGFVGVLFQVFRKQSTMTVRLRQEPSKFICISLVGAISQLSLAVYFVRYLDWGSLGVLRSYACASFISLVASIIASGWIWKGSFDISALRGMLAFGFPLLPAAAATWSLDFLNRFLIQHLVGSLETTIYGVGIRISAILSIVFFGFQMAWGPFAYSLMKQPEHAAKVYADVARWLCFVGGIAVLAISLFAKELILLLTKPEYLDAAEIVPLLGVAALLWSLYYIVCIGYQYAKKSYYQLYSMLTGLGSLLAVSFFLIPCFGATAAALGTLIGYAVAVFFAFRFSQRYLRIEYQWRKICATLLIFLIVSILLNNYIFNISTLDFSYTILKIFLIKLLILISGGIIAMMMLITNDERNSIKSFLYRIGYNNLLNK